jgi:cytoskeletal protein RodZ
MGDMWDEDSWNEELEKREEELSNLEGNFQESDSDYEKELNSEDKNEKEVKVKKVSKYTCFFFLMFICVLAIIIMMSVRACSVTKSVKSSQKIDSAKTSIYEEDKGTKKSEETGTKNIAESTENQEVSNRSSDKKESMENIDTESKSAGELFEEAKKSLNGDSSENSSNSTNGSISGLTEVEVPDLSESFKAPAVVGNKSIYSINSTNYVYRVSLVLQKKSGEKIELSYFCPRKTYDGIFEGDEVTVELQKSKDEMYSIVSVSK